MDKAFLKSIVFGGGCFWCIEALFSELKGVFTVQSGYAGGNTQNPTYEEIQKTNHTEVIRVQFDPEIISLKNLIYIFFHVHDATAMNKKAQYRSSIFYQKQNHTQLCQIQQVLKQVLIQEKYPGAPQKINTQIRQLQQFYKAEKKHQRYFQTNKQKNNSYCEVIIKPNLSKFKELFQIFVKG